MNKKEIVKIAKSNLAELTGFNYPRIRYISKEHQIWKATIDITEEFLGTLAPEIIWTYDVLIDLSGNFRGYSKIRGKRKEKNTLKKSLRITEESLWKYLLENPRYSHI